jgi:hypothetical protein
LCPAAEVTSNGTGGGAWSDPTTWRGKTVPGPEDDAVVARGDLVVFDRNDDTLAYVETAASLVGGDNIWADCAALLVGSQGKTTCRQLLIDPKGMLTFKSGAGRLCFCCAGPVEAYGTFKLDARASASDRFEFRLVGETTEKRSCKFVKGGSLIMLGRPGLENQQCNVVISSRPQPGQRDLFSFPEHGEAVVDGGEGATIEVQHAAVNNVLLRGTGIDNTGAKPNERFNITDSRFCLKGRIYASGCDSPLIANNHFELADARISMIYAAITVYGSPLAEVRGNFVRGRYIYAIGGHAQTDSVVTDNTAEGCATGIYWYGANGMIRKFTARDCDTGVVVTSMSGALDDILIENCTMGYNHAGANAQISNMRIAKVPPKNGVVVYYSSGPMTLINCNVKPEQIKIHEVPKPGAKDPHIEIQAMENLVVSVKAGAPPGSYVEVATAQRATPLAPGAADLNIRNVPAQILSNGLTPLPTSREPIVVKSWAYDAAGKLIPAPEYIVRILAPGQDRKELKALKVKPDQSWYRTPQNLRVPTVEVSLK